MWMDSCLSFTRFCLLLVMVFFCPAVSAFNIDATSYNSFQHESIERYFMLYIPQKWRNFNGPVELPVFVVDHGGGTSAQQAAGIPSNDYYMGFKKVSEATEDFVVVYPEGECTSLHTECGMNHGGVLPGGSTLDDIGFVDKLLTELATNPIVNDLTIDLRNVYMCGHSNGAAFNYHYAHYNNLPHGVKAIAPYAAHEHMDQEATLKVPPSSVCLLHVHGDGDTRIPLEYPPGGSYEWNIEYWLNHNQCPDTDFTVNALTTWDFSNTVKLVEYSSQSGRECPKGGKVRGMVFIGQPHDWPPKNPGTSHGLVPWPPQDTTASNFMTGTTSFASAVWKQLKEMTELDCVPQCHHGDCVSGKCENCESGWEGDFCNIELNGDTSPGTGGDTSDTEITVTNNGKCYYKFEFSGILLMIVCMWILLE